MRFSIFHVQSYRSTITAAEADYVLKILRAAFRGAHYYDFDSDLDFDNAVSLSLASSKRTLCVASDSRILLPPAVKKRKTVPLVRSKSFDKKDFYDLTMTDSDDDVVMDIEDPGASLAEPMITQDIVAEVSPETKPKPQMVRALDAFVRTLIMNTTTRVVEINKYKISSRGRCIVPST